MFFILIIISQSILAHTQSLQTAAQALIKSIQPTTLSSNLTSSTLEGFTNTELGIQNAAKSTQLENRSDSTSKPHSANKFEALYFISAQNHRALKKITGIKIVSALPNQYYIIRTIDNKPPSHPTILYCIPATFFNKASENLLNHYQLATKPQTIQLILKITSTESKDFLAHYGAIIALNNNYITLKTQTDQLPSLLALPNVEFADVDRNATAELSIKNMDLTANQIVNAQTLFPTLKGKGLIVSIKEDQYDTEDLDLLGRTIPSSNPAKTITSHATTMATLIGGNGNSYINGLGVAPEAMLSSSNFSRLLPDSIEDLNSNNISIQNHSYGTGIENYYGIEALEYDKQISNTDTIIHIFSTGNIGTTAPTLGYYQGINNHANLTGTFKQAKNVLVVGGTSREQAVESLSSKGPAYDGRVKPDIVALGQDGTSGAAALATGVACLLKQQYLHQFQQAPSAALIKSILINSADDIGNAHVDYDSGFGSINALEAIKTINESRFITGVLTSQQELSYPIQIDPETKAFKVTLAWNDPPATLNAPQALVNDLDIWIEDSSGNRILPWVLNPTASLEALLAPATQQKDSLNNVEQVSMEYPQAGSYTIHVYGYRVIEGNQAFHLSYQATPANHFEWNFPTPNAQFFANDDNYLRFKNTFNTAGSLFVSFDSGTNWTPIASNIDHAINFYKWHTPDMFTTALLKMNIEGHDFISPPFSISRPVNFNVGYDCNDRLLLYWDKQPESTNYIIYTLKDNKLQPLTSTPETLIHIPKTSTTSDYFAVSAQNTANIEGLKGYTLNVKEQGMGCYVGSLLANSSSKTIVLALQLGTTVGLSGTIQCQKQTGPSNYTPIASTAVSTSLQYLFTDTAPQQGLQHYRIILETTDGKQIISNTTSIAYLDALQFVMFPNPASEQLSVLSGNLETYQFTIYTMDGRVVSTYVLNSLRNNFSINNLPTGTYFCKITLNEKPVFETKLIKQ